MPLNPLIWRYHEISGVSWHRWLRCNGCSLGVRHLLHCASISAKASAPKVPQTAAVVPPQHCKGVLHMFELVSFVHNTPARAHVCTSIMYIMYVPMCIYVPCLYVGIYVCACAMCYAPAGFTHTTCDATVTANLQYSVRAVSKSLHPSSVATKSYIGKPIIENQMPGITWYYWRGHCV